MEPMTAEFVVADALRQHSMPCKRCNGQGRDCWVLMAVVVGRFAGEPYPRVHMAFAEVCPFCDGTGKEVADEAE